MGGRQRILREHLTDRPTDRKVAELNELVLARTTNAGRTAPFQTDTDASHVTLRGRTDGRRDGGTVGRTDRSVSDVIFLISSPTFYASLPPTDREGKSWCRGKKAAAERETPPTILSRTAEMELSSQQKIEIPRDAKTGPFKRNCFGPLLGQDFGLLQHLWRVLGKEFKRLSFSLPK